MNCVENLDGEIWRYVMSEELGFYSYMVSDKGRVKSLNFNKTGDERLLKQSKDKDGYLRVSLYRKGEKEKIFPVHRLVALMFIKNPDNLPQINHLDEIKTNNSVENLCWCSCKENLEYKDGREKRTKTRKETIKNSTAWKEFVVKAVAEYGKKVYQYTTDGELVNIYPSAHEAGRQTGYSQGNISAYCRGKRKTAYGFIWSYTPLPTSTNQLSLFQTTETEKN